MTTYSHGLAAIAGAVVTASVVGFASATSPHPSTCKQGVVPDPTCTPGSTLPVGTQQVCVPGYAASVRDVSRASRKQVVAAYGVTLGEGKYEVDHLISLELGGSNEPDNLWPQPYAATPGARDKDRVENEAHDRVCSGSLALDDAQREIAADWVGFGRGLGVQLGG